MFLDCFQLGLEKVKLFESVDRPNTTHKFVIMWNVTLEFVWTTGFPSFLSRRCVWTWTELWLSKFYFCRTESYIIEGDSCPLVVISCSLFCCRFMDRVFNFLLVLLTWPPSVNIVGVGVGGRATTMDWIQALYFFLLASSLKMPRSPCLAHKAPVTSPLIWLLRLPTLTSIDLRRCCQKDQSKHEPLLKHYHLSGYQKYRQRHKT